MGCVPKAGARNIGYGRCRYEVFGGRSPARERDARRAAHAKRYCGGDGRCGDQRVLGGADRDGAAPGQERREARHIGGDRIADRVAGDGQANRGRHARRAAKPTGHRRRASCGGDVSSIARNDREAGSRDAARTTPLDIGDSGDIDVVGDEHPRPAHADASRAAPRQSGGPGQGHCCDAFLRQRLHINAA